MLWEVWIWEHHQGPWGNDYLHTAGWLPELHGDDDDDDDGDDDDDDDDGDDGDDDDDDDGGNG